MSDLLLTEEYQEAVYYAELGSPVKGKKAIDKLLAKARPIIYQEGYEAGFQDRNKIADWQALKGE